MAQFWKLKQVKNGVTTEAQRPKFKAKNFLTDLLTKFYGHWIDENIYSSLTYVLFNPLNKEAALFKEPVRTA